MKSSTLFEQKAVIHAFDLLAHRHDRGLAWPNLLESSLYHAATWEAIRQLLPDNQPIKVLDVGCGNGLWSVQLARLGHYPVLVDISFQMAQIAQKKLAQEGLGAITIQGDGHNLTFLPENYFDLVLGVGDLLCYTKDPAVVFQQLYRCCKPGGKLVVSVIGQYGLLPYLFNHPFTIKQLDEYLCIGIWQEFTAKELGEPATLPLFARAYSFNKLSDTCRSSGWQIDSGFGAGILRTILGRKKLDQLISEESMSTILTFEQRLAQETKSLDFAQEFGLIAYK